MPLCFFLLRRKFLSFFDALLPLHVLSGHASSLVLLLRVLSSGGGGLMSTPKRPATKSAGAKRIGGIGSKKDVAAAAAKAAEEAAAAGPPKPKIPAHQMSSMTWAEEEILRNRVDELSLRAQTLQKRVDELQHMLKMADLKHKTDYDSAVNENVRLSQENTALARDNASLTAKLERQKEESESLLAHTIADREQEFMAREQQLLNRSKELQHENLGLYEFKEKREKLWSDLQKFQDTLEHNELKYKNDLANCERKWSLITKKTTDDAQALIRDERRRYKLEVRDELDGEFHFTSAENRRLTEELKYHVDTSKRLATENETLSQQLKKYKIELALTKDKDESVSPSSSLPFPSSYSLPPLPTLVVSCRLVAGVCSLSLGVIIIGNMQSAVSVRLNRSVNSPERLKHWSDHSHKS